MNMSELQNCYRHNSALPDLIGSYRTILLKTAGLPKLLKY